MVRRNHSPAVNILLTKTECASILEVFYRNASKSFSNTSKRMKYLRRRTMFENVVKGMMREFEGDDYLDIALGREGHPTESVFAEEVAITTMEAFTKAIVNDRSIARAMDIPWAAMLMFLTKY
ncbi:hypothetical protein HNY73_018452 [Argiope bruennichi]|uniref:Uncharacterized protein n=1 Tax=Argiope bruennichi TaxID=94029 RepID=A0A8T0EHW5_ARGBR|nr:hypothetical protein HNY73_018452 [Argiope bruennichi]